jgi:tRNA nucleotidyltransferase/poly(A) polymerase
MKLRQLVNILDEIHKEYETSTPYICGGLPRDKYLKRLSSVSDVDLTTGDKTIDILSLEVFNHLSEKFKIKREIKKDGHSSIYFKNIKIDFSSNYIDEYAKEFLTKNNKKISSLILESTSRDFGCNSLLLSLDLKTILDPTGVGKNHCDNKIIKTILPPQITFKPNPKTQNNNRVIRSIYLACKLNFDIDQSIIDYVSSNPQIITLTDPKTLAKKINSSYELDSDKTIYYLKKMNLFKNIPINNLLSDEMLRLLANRA